MGAPQCLARGGPLPAEVALDAGRTTTCKGSTPTDASRPEPRERTAGQRDPGFETCELVTITNLAEKNRDSTLGGGAGTRLLEAAVGVWTEVFKYISFSNPSAQ